MRRGRARVLGVAAVIEEHRECSKAGPVLAMPLLWIVPGLLALLLWCHPAFAQDVASPGAGDQGSSGAHNPAEPGSSPGPATTPCDPAQRACGTRETWILGLRTWTPGAEARNIAGGRLQLELHRRAWRAATRIDGTTTAGAYRQGDLSTVRDVEAHVAVAYDALRLPDAVTVGPMLAIGAAVVLPENKLRASLPRALTAVLGLRASWRDGWAYAGAGSVQEFERGVGLKVTWQIRQSAHTASVGTVSYGRRWLPLEVGPEGEVLSPGRSEAGVFAWVGVAVRFP